MLNRVETKRRLSAVRRPRDMGRQRQQCVELLIERIDECMSLIAAGKHREARRVFQQMDQLREKLKDLDKSQRQRRYRL